MTSSEETSAPGGRPLLNRGLAEFGTTIFAEMSALAVRTGAINLGQDGPGRIVRCADQQQPGAEGDRAP